MSDSENDPPLPTSWTLRTSRKRNNRRYYYHRESNCSVWEHPENIVHLPAVPPQKTERLSQSIEKSAGLYVVVDTNILLREVELVKKLNDYAFHLVGYSKIVVPWIVQQELEALKDPQNRANLVIFQAGCFERTSVSLTKAFRLGSKLDHKFPPAK